MGKKKPAPTKPAPVKKKKAPKKSKSESEPVAEFKPKTCPKCGAVAEDQETLIELFGMRRVRDKEIPQSYCKPCRKSAAS